MSDRSGTTWIAIEGENAKKIYDIIINSHTYKEYPSRLCNTVPFGR